MRITDPASARGALALLLLATSVAVATAQSPMADHGRFLAASGEAAAGVPGGLVHLDFFGGPGVEDSGAVVFSSRLAQAGSLLSQGVAYFRGTTRDDLQLLLRDGDAEPSGTLPGVTVATLTREVRVAGSGTLLFGADLAGPGVSASNDAALFVGAPGAVQRLVREGDAAVGTIGAVHGTPHGGLTLGGARHDAAGRVFFRSTLSGGDVVGTSNDEALYTGTPGALALVVREGDGGPGGEVVGSLVAGRPQIGAGGRIAFEVGYQVGSGAVPVTADDDQAIWLHTPGTGNQELVREGDPAPVAGLSFGHATLNSSPFTVGRAALDATGRLAVRARLRGPGVGTGDQGIFILDPQGHVLVARRGAPAPGLTGATLDFLDADRICLSDSGVIAFSSSLAGAVGPTANYALFAGTPGNLSLVARLGTTAPGTGGSLFGDFQTSAFSTFVDASGRVVFRTQLIGGSRPGWSLWSWDATEGLRALSFRFEAVEVAPGDVRATDQPNVDPDGNGDARGHSFAHDGTLGVHFATSPSGRAIAALRLGSLTGVPPTIAFAAGGTQRLLLDGGPLLGGQPYFLAGSASGTAPGLPLGTLTVPLNPDPWFDWTVLNPNVPPMGNNLGFLDARGRAEATVTVPPVVSGLTLGLSWAYVALAPGGFFVSEPATLQLVP